MNDEVINIILEVEVKTPEEKKDFLNKFENFNGKILNYWIGEK